MSSRFTHVYPVIRYFYGLVWQYRKSYFLLIAANMLWRGLTPFVNIVLPRFIIDELIGAERLAVVAGYVGVLVGANFAIYLINNGRDYLLNLAHSALSMQFDALIGQKTMDMDFAYTENPQVLTQLEKAKTGMSWYSGGIEGLTGNLTAIVSGFITLCGTVYIIGSLSPWLIAMVIVLVFMSMLVTLARQKAHVQFMKDLVGINRRFNYYFGLLKNFQYGKDIRLYNAAELLTQRVNGYIDQEWGIQAKRTLMENRYSLILTALDVCQQAILYGYLGLLVVAGAISIGQFQMLVSAAYSFSNSLSNVLNQVVDLGKTCDFMHDYKVFMEYPSVMAKGCEKPTSQPKHVLEVRNVSFKYPGRDELVLKNVSITIPAGQKLSVVGPNGAGKTTFIKLLCRLYEPTEGEILLDGVNINNYDLDEYRKLFAVVFQDFKLLAFSLRENIAASRTSDEDAVKRAVAQVGLASRVATLPQGLETSVYKTFDKAGVEFSGGESQKIAIARAIYKNSPIVILDEPTAALDPIAEYEVYTHFNELVSGKTAIYISHRLSSCRFCDKIAVFDNGRLVEHGDHAALCANNGLYAQMWQAQSQWYVEAEAASAS